MKCSIFIISTNDFFEVSHYVKVPIEIEYWIFRTKKIILSVRFCFY